MSLKQKFGPILRRWKLKINKFIGQVVDVIKLFLDFPKIKKLKKVVVMSEPLQKC